VKLATVIYQNKQYLALIQNNTAKLYIGEYNWASVLDIIKHSKGNSGENNHSEDKHGQDALLCASG